MWKIPVDLLGSSRCRRCGERGPALCGPCLREVGRPREKAIVPGAARVLVPFVYEDPARALVLDLKLRARRAAATPLVAGICDEAMRIGLLGNRITWVPGRRAGIKERGFDHAEVLARGVGARLGLPVTPALEAVFDRLDQTELSAAERRRNLSGAFTARACTGSIVVVDDLITTGATAAAAATALLAAGASRVEILAACRAER
ncbi:MAG: ComF family protein [Actinomycetota bacterium]